MVIAIAITVVPPAVSITASPIAVVAKAGPAPGDSGSGIIQDCTDHMDPCPGMYLHAFSQKLRLGKILADNKDSGVCDSG